jgi:hypothetical protein
VTVDAELARQVRELIQAMRVRRWQLERALEEVQVSVLRAQLDAAEVVGPRDHVRLDYPPGPPELVGESVAAQTAIAESHRLERYWERAGVKVPDWPEP